MLLIVNNLVVINFRTNLQPKTYILQHFRIVIAKAKAEFRYLFAINNQIRLTQRQHNENSVIILFE